ncbi:MAG: T9SS type A sorting domain-containing protein [Balneola sp.]
MKFLLTRFFGVLFFSFTFLLAQAQTIAPKIAVGSNQSLVLTDDGSVYTFGDGTYGTLGQGNDGRVDIAISITHANLGGKKIIASDTNKGASGNSFTLLIAEDSTVYSFGANDEGQLGHGDIVDRRDPTQITHTNITGKKFVAVAAGQERSYLLTSDGLVFSMGSNNDGYLGIGSTSPSRVLVPTLIDTTNLSGHNIVQISTGAEHTLMLSDSNYVFGFGLNSNGQLGDGATISSRLAIEIPKANFGNKTLVDIEVGVLSSMALADDGTVFSWGNFGTGLGHGTLSADLRTPTAITHANLSGKTITKISKTHQTALMLASDGTVFIFGDDVAFDLMDFPTEFTSSSTLGKTISDISIGYEHGLILADDGTVYGFGNGGNGRNGVGTQATVNTPRLINDTFTTGKKITHLSAGVDHSIIIDSAGVAYSFGGRDVADFGNSTINYSLGRSFHRIADTPTELSHSNLSGKTIVEIAAGGKQSFLLTDQGEVFVFGEGLKGALGLVDSVDVYIPTKIDHANISGKKITKVATGWNGGTGSTGTSHTLLLAEDGSVFAMGSNDSGQLGLGDFLNRRVPTEITHANISGKTITNIAVGAQHSMLIASDGSVFLWGRGGNGEMGFGNTDTLHVPTLASHLSALGKNFIDGAIGFSSNNPHFLLLADDNSLYSFGENSDGQLGQGNKTDNYVPTQIISTNISGKIVSDVIAGEKTSMLLMNDGPVFSFGNTHTVGIEGSSFTDFSEPTLLSNAAIVGKRAIAIAANLRHGLAILDEGTVLSFGSDVSNSSRLGALGNGLPESGDETPQPIANFNWLTSPIPTTNLAIHLDAGRGLTTFGDSVNTWNNLSGSGFNATQGELAIRPLRADSAINNLPALRFNGTNTYFRLPTTTNLGIQNADYELFLVAKTSVATTDIDYLLSGEPEHIELFTNGSAGVRFVPSNSQIVETGSVNQFSDGTAHVYNLRATDTQATLSVDRGFTSSSAINGRSTTGNGIVIGVRQGGTNYLAGDVAEIIIYDEVLTDNDRRAVESYLFKKYAIQNYKESSGRLTGTEGWRLLTSPVADSSFAPLLKNIWTQGFTGAKTAFGTSNVYTWPNTSTTLSDTNWTALTNMADSLHPGQGVLVYVFSDDNGPGVAGDAGFPKTFALEGREPQGAQSLTARLNPNVNGWAMVGNPFRNDIDWDGFTKSGLSNSVYVYDHNASGWKSWNGTLGSLSEGGIGSFNGFFVQTLLENPTLEIPTSAKSDSANKFLGKQVAKANPHYFSLELKSDSGFTNKAWFQFSEEGEFGIDASDAYQLNPLSSKYVTIASALNDSIHLDINSLPVISEAYEVKLALQTTETGGAHRISKTDFNLPEGWEISLHDSELDVTTNLSEAYTFTMEASKSKIAQTQPLTSPPSLESIVKPAKQKQVGARFTLSITPATTVNGEPFSDLPQTVELEQNYPNPFNPSSVIQFGVPELSKVRLEVFDILGRKVATLLNDEVTQAGRYNIQFHAGNLASGMYVYRLQVGNSVLTKKMTLIK